jgi:hypothetical protein
MRASLFGLDVLAQYSDPPYRKVLSCKPSRFDGRHSGAGTLPNLRFCGPFRREPLGVPASPVLRS